MGVPQFVVVGALFEGLVRDLTRDPALREFPAQSRAGQPAGLGAGPDEHPRVGPIVHEVHFLEPVEHLPGDVLGDVAVREFVLELVPRLGRCAQLAQDDGAGDVAGIGFRFTR